MPISPGQSGVIFRVVCQVSASETLSGLLKCNRAGALDVKSACAPARKVNRGVRFGWYPVVDAHDQERRFCLFTTRNRVPRAG